MRADNRHQQGLLGRGAGEEERNDERVSGWTGVREQTGPHAKPAGAPGKGLLCKKPSALRTATRAVHGSGVAVPGVVVCRVCGRRGSRDRVLNRWVVMGGSERE